MARPEQATKVGTPAAADPQAKVSGEVLILQAEQADAVIGPATQEGADRLFRSTPFLGDLHNTPTYSHFQRLDRVEAAEVPTKAVMGEVTTVAAPMLFTVQTSVEMEHSVAEAVAADLP